VSNDIQAIEGAVGYLDSDRKYAVRDLQCPFGFPSLQTGFTAGIALPSGTAGARRLVGLDGVLHGSWMGALVAEMHRARKRAGQHHAGLTDVSSKQTDRILPSELAVRLILAA